MPDGLKDFVADLGRGEQFWHDVVNTMSEIFLVVDPQRRIVFANRGAEQLTGMSAEEVRGRRCTEALSCPQCACVCRLFEQGEVDRLEVVIHDPKTAEPRTFLKNARLLHDSQGRLLGGVETLSEITSEVEQRIANRRRMDLLLREKQRYQVLQDSIHGGVLVLDADLKVRDFSARMSEMTGFDAGRAEGRDIRELFAIDDRDEFPCSLAHMDAKPVDVVLHDADGAPVEVRFLFRPLSSFRDEVLAIVQPRSRTEHASQATNISSLPHEPDTDSSIDIRRHNFEGIMTRSAAMYPVVDLIKTTADADVPILIEGESGTGKEVVARAIHRCSSRKDKPLYAVNCSTLTGSLLLSELFGHERGAFTGAHCAKQGKLELAEGGTLFLDEVSEIPLEHQSLLLRVLEEHTFERVGGTRKIPVNARVVAASNQPLAQQVERGLFRADLYYRLRVVPIELPPLRRRQSDIDLLGRHFLSRACRTYGRTPKALTSDAWQALREHSWPGNVRELRNLMEYLSLTGAPLIDRGALPVHVRGEGRREPEKAASERGDTPVGPEAHESDADHAERARIVAALESSHFRRMEAARLLGIDRTTLWRRMRRLGVAV